MLKSRNLLFIVPLSTPIFFSGILSGLSLLCSPLAFLIAQLVRVFGWLQYLSYPPSDADVLMDFPELYRYGRERTWFSLKLFFFYMIDGAIQVCYFGVSSAPY